MSKPASVILANEVLRPASSVLQGLNSTQISIEHNTSKALSNHIYLVYNTVHCISMEWKI